MGRESVMGFMNLFMVSRPRDRGLEGVGMALMT